MRMHYTLKFNLRVIQDLEDEDDLDNMVSHGDDFANVYIVESPCVDAIEANIPNTQLTFGLREINPITIVEYTSHEGHFMQLFIAHAFSIQGFIMGCRSILAIDSCHLSGSYKGALLSAIVYDVDDGIFPLALDVENFSSFFNRQNIRGKKGKEDVLLLLDNITYARLDIDYNKAFRKLVLFNDNLAKWVAENSLVHSAMSKFLKRR
ncbi:hypothetical protein AAG906_026169 [Vitis piasezkii]